LFHPKKFADRHPGHDPARARQKSSRVVVGHPRHDRVRAESFSAPRPTLV
jgi:hypothetical protein